MTEIFLDLTGKDMMQKSGYPYQISLLPIIRKSAVSVGIIGDLQTCMERQFFHYIMNMTLSGGRNSLPSATERIVEMLFFFANYSSLISRSLFEERNSFALLS